MRVGSKWAILTFIPVVGVFAFVHSATAACKGAGYRFSFRGEVVRTTRDIDPGSQCVMNYSAGETSTFENAAIVIAPKHGRAEQINKARYTYTPSAGYHGADYMEVRICGHNIRDNGCSTIAYSMNIK